ncbi:MAG: hypothetical protein WD851_00035 [Pirellulales bacterium]
MKLTDIHSFLVHPAKHADSQPTISGTSVPRKGSLFGMLDKLFERAPMECDVQIVFSPDDQGQQNNPSRDSLESYAREPSVPRGRIVAERLQQVTTHRSGLGLLFLLKGIGSQGHHSLVVSRFPADQGVVAQENAGSLSVEFLERVFMKNAKAYKSAYYTTSSLRAGFTDGKAVDRQLSGPRDLSEYWIGEFLMSELRTTGPAGTRRLAEALRTAVKTAKDPGIKQELISAASLMRNQSGKTRSATAIIKRLGLSDQAAEAITDAYARPELMSESFRFEADEFERHALYRAVELDTGALLLAEDARFDDVFHTELLVAERKVRYTTEGKIVDQRFRKTK